MYKDKKITFEDIHRLHYNQFNAREDVQFNPREILDLEDNSDDEILKRFRKGKKK